MVAVVAVALLLIIIAIVAGNSAGNCAPLRPIHSLGSNLDSGNSCFPGSAIDLADADPKEREL